MVRLAIIATALIAAVSAAPQFGLSQVSEPFPQPTGGLGSEPSFPEPSRTRHHTPSPRHHTPHGTPTPGRRGPHHHHLPGLPTAILPRWLIAPRAEPTGLEGSSPFGGRPQAGGEASGAGEAAGASNPEFPAFSGRRPHRPTPTPHHRHTPTPGAFGGRGGHHGGEQGGSLPFPIPTGAPELPGSSSSGSGVRHPEPLSGPPQ